MEEWHEHPERFTGRPKLPGYKHKTQGRNLLVYEKGAIWKRIIHSDVNGSYNIGRKVVPTAFDGLGIAAPAVRPRRLAV